MVEHRHQVTQRGGIAIAALRIALGFVFLWAFLDKTFGLGYAHPDATSPGSTADRRPRASSSGVDVGPFQSFFNTIAGTWWANILFMARPARDRCSR